MIEVKIFINDKEIYNGYYDCIQEFHNDMLSPSDFILFKSNGAGDMYVRKSLIRYYVVKIL